MAINELRAITTFVQAAELGNLSKAAVAQQISPQAASKVIGQLEAYLGVRLFHRTTRSISLTEEGQRFLDAVQPSVVGLQQALQTALKSRESAAGPLRISGPRSVFKTVIGPVMDEFIRHNPDVQPNIQFDDRFSNWVEERIDVGFRLGHAPQEGLIARRLFPIQLIICATPSYLRKYGTPQSLFELTSHRCSAFRRAQDNRDVPWTVKVGDSIQDLYVHSVFCTNDEEFELRTVLAGEVIAQLATSTAAVHIREGRLVPILVEHMADNYNLYVYFGSRTSTPTRVRNFIDLATERLSNNQQFVLSDSELKHASQWQYVEP
nr:LysR family transcriptional regulator [uncultured Tolumonas sp.]